MERIYLDNSATTKICKEALDKYIEVSGEHFGNPSSLHALGLDAEKIIEAARDEIRTSLGARGTSVIFTASGSEANNLAIIGRAYAKERFARGKIITTAGEHASVDEPLKKLEAEGYRIARIPTVGGKLDLEVLKNELTPDTVLVTMMMVNNETGALYDISAAAKLTKSLAKNALVHVDATQSYMKIPFTKASLGADMITLSSHKIEGPKGVGALVVDANVIKSGGISPLILGGGQEGGLRSGTENVPAIAAFSEAARIGRAKLTERYAVLKGLKSYLLDKLSAMPEISITLPESAAPNIVNITLPNIKSETMLHHLSSYGIFVSSGSACSSNSKHSSSALVAYGRSPEEADSSIRISLSHRNTEAELDAFIEALGLGLARLSRIRR